MHNIISDLQKAHLEWRERRKYQQRASVLLSQKFGGEWLLNLTPVHIEASLVVSERKNWNVLESDWIVFHVPRNGSMHVRAGHTLNALETLPFPVVYTSHERDLPAADYKSQEECLRDLHKNGFRSVLLAGIAP